MVVSANEGYTPAMIRLEMGVIGLWFAGWIKTHSLLRCLLTASDFTIPIAKTHVEKIIQTDCFHA
jgi:hypothetical protein